METVTITKKEYQKLQAAKARLDALSNVSKLKTTQQEGRFADLVGALRDVEEFKGKTSVEVQHMSRDIWTTRKL